ncbi:EF-P beta-lysylation protein EpmB [Alteromonas sp. KUL49]|uniref:EF-P beta-lysylation protein EpmB n=1 Tax=Alteromonas sp. KUL49 TaxID=2480798 RepID=UPI00102F2890|nr:EF-P beta-lysylation protein EpmB [Alteromonas sp. KUL49]TAP38988.1 EF-P beta-lysylation protein EpmB [Alteromonas sp. KUL49]GEA12434.1 EF-P beta-lysylation protein EpmB [Alteromonas sp. KUL49]
MSQIIPKKAISVESNWQKELAQSFSDPLDLVNYLQLDTESYTQHSKARRLFPMRVPRHFADLMEKGNPQDPLFLQVMPLSDEFLSTPGYSEDPLEEHDTAGRGLLHKYESRVLLMVRTGCAVNCRYCFRRHFPYGDNSVNKQQWQETIDYIAQHPEINEVIFSGGDPLMAKDEQLSWLANQLANIEHVKRLRIHTRLPVVLPQRVDTQFVQWLTRLPIKTVVVLHINHANEVSAALKSRLQKLQQSGVTLLNQAVLLKGVNDSGEALINLSESLFDAGILPYYLHVLDKVQGASHFYVSDDEARVLMEKAIKRLPGFLVPRLVREIGGQPGKTPIDLHLHP